MAKFIQEDREILSADAEHPVSSMIDTRGNLTQQGISCEGFQREVGVSRHTSAPDARGRQRYCYELTFFQSPGVRYGLPLGCTPLGNHRQGSPPAPAEARRFAKALHRAAQAGYDPREATTDAERNRRGGGPRGSWWHRLVLPIACGKPELAAIKATLRAHGYWPKSADIVPGQLDRDTVVAPRGARGPAPTSPTAPRRRGFEPSLFGSRRRR